MHLEIVSDKALAKFIFTQGSLTDDTNSKNYTPKQFEIAWPLWLNFYVLYDGSDVVCFTGIRKFAGGYARIFDRYFIEPDYRLKSLAHNEYSLYMVQTMCDDVIASNMIPFFSIQEEKKRRALEVAVLKFNKCLSSKNAFHVLDGMYNTVTIGCSWQNIAIQKPHNINLKRKPL